MDTARPGRQRPLRKPGIVTAQMVCLKSGCEVLVDEAVHGAFLEETTFQAAREFRAGRAPCQGQLKCSHVQGQLWALGCLGPCHLQPPAWAESFSRSQTIPGDSSRASHPSDSDPYGQRESELGRGLHSCVAASREALITKRAGGRLLWELYRD